MLKRRSILLLTLLFLAGTTFLAIRHDNGSVFPLLVVPIVLFGLAYRSQAGLAAAAAASLYTVAVITVVLGRLETMPYVFVAVLVFLGVGYVVGRMTDLCRTVLEQRRLLSETNTKLEAAVAEKDLLIREVHHRVKNDLALVRSLLSVKARQAEGPEARRTLEESARKIDVLAGVYQKLHHQDSSGLVPLRELFSEFASRWDGAEADITVHADDIRCDSRTAVSLGIIVNELVTNALKHGDHRQESPRVEVMIAGAEASEVSLMVRDNGPGLPPQVLRSGEYGFGLTIVQELVGQHDGTVTLENDGGARISVAIPGNAER